MSIRHDVIEPATEGILASILETSPEEVDWTIQRSRKAQRSWAAAPPAERTSVIHAVADAIDLQVEQLAVIEARNVGMPIRDARGSMASVAATFRYYAAGPERLLGHTIPVAGGIDMTFREPIGVVGLITPWNFPLAIASWKVAPGLAAGNGVVLKPSELTPLTAIELVRIAEKAGLPEGLFGVVLGPGSTVGRQLVDHPLVGKVAFTGSTAVGREVGARAAGMIKRVTLELGGKSASIIFADADLDRATSGLAAGAFGNTGQDCCARSRVFVERSALDDVLDRMAVLVDGLKVGSPLSEATEMGPLISAKQRERVKHYVESSTIAHQGSAPRGAGFWYPATVLYPVDEEEPAAREEIFGPVVSVFAFDDEDEVIRRVNDTPYGLSGSVWSRDGGRALRMARAIESGALAINSYNSVRLSTPFGGFKESGMGRELGPDVLEAYTEVKNVFYSTEV